MGYNRHHAIVITTFDKTLIEQALEQAEILCDQCSPIMAAPLNGWNTILVPPDGSKEGWEESDLGDAGRAKLIEWLDSKRYDDGSSPFSWVEVQYGDDDRETKVTAHSDEHSRWDAANREGEES